ncbi:MAG: hypothetical protein AAF581_02475 [Planctomycetota bacterium]
MVFGFGRKKNDEERRRRQRRLDDLESERAGLQEELEHLSKKHGVELGASATDKTTSLSRFPKRVVEVKIRLDEIDRSLRVLREQL